MAQDFATYMTRFHGSQTTTPGAAGYYRVLTDNGAADQNCFAYAVGKATRINAQTRAQLIEECKSTTSLLWCMPQSLTSGVCYPYVQMRKCTTTKFPQLVLPRQVTPRYVSTSMFTTFIEAHGS